MAETGNLPNGLVAFVFTDIEGSTQLIRRLGDRYADVLDRHHELLRAVWADHDGVEVHTGGDSFLVAFADSTNAVEACAAAQLAFANEPWPADGVVRIRIGAHAGVAYPHEGDYVALAVHQAARIMSVANGGQVVVSREIVDRSSIGVALRLASLGRFRVRDFDEPIPLFGVGHAELAEVNIALRALPADGHNLTRAVTSMVDRVEELKRLDELVKPGTLTTMLGPGGVGKTRVATEFGRQVAQRWRDGVWFVSLASLTAGELIPGAIADAVHSSVAGATNPTEKLLSDLEVSELVLILDNCEGLTTPTAEITSELRERCPELAILATSREPLGLAGEQQVRLAPFENEESVALAARPAVRLFLDRANPDLALERTDLAGVSTLCERLDGLPLAIELAAARTDVISPAEILAALEDRQSILSATDPSIPARQRTLEGLVDWSYDLLSSDEQTVLERLSVFGSTFDIGSAEAACADNDEDRAGVTDSLWSLVGKSLIHRVSGIGATRYGMLTTLRAHVRHKLSPDDHSEVARRLADHFDERLGPDRRIDRQWINDVDLDLDNLRSLVADPSLDARTRLRLAWSIGRFHDVRDSFVAGIHELSRAATEVPTAMPELVAVLTLIADLRLRMGDVGEASDVLAKAKDAERVDGRAPWDDGGVERTAGEIALRRNELDEAERIATEALATPHSRRAEARLWNLLGLARASRDDMDGASEAFEAELLVWSELGLETFLPAAHGNVAEALLRLGRSRDAAQHQLSSLELGSELGQPVVVAFSLSVAAQITAAAGGWVEAARLQGAADQMLTEIDFVLYETDAEAREARLDGALEGLGARNLETALDDGRNMTPEQAVAAASNVLRQAAWQGDEIDGR